LQIDSVMQQAQDAVNTAIGKLISEFSNQVEQERQAA
jgi:hypothetical protein